MSGHAPWAARIARAWRNEGGSVAIVAALSIVMLLMAAGLAVDAMRAYNIRPALQAAADAAALAAASESSRTSGKVAANASAFFQANGIPAAVATVTAPVVVHDTAARTVTVSATATMNTSFMKLAGFDSLTIPVSATAGYSGGGGSLELVVAVDTSVSMSTRVFDLAVNLQPFRTGLYSDLSGRIKMGGVHFNSYVRLNSADYPGAIASGSGIGLRPTCSCTTAICEGGTFMCAGLNSVYYGCVGARPAALLESIADVASNLYPRIYGNCNITMTTVDITSDTFLMQDFISKTNNGGPGNTFIPNGLLWAWHMLTPGIPFNSTSTGPNVVKAVLLISDGRNTASPRYPQNDFVASAINPDTSWLDGTKADAMTLSLCTKMKNAGIKIFTLYYNDPNAAGQALLRSCASSMAESYEAFSASTLSAHLATIRQSMKAMVSGAGGGAPFLIK